jgi:phospho-2-dehydro-3-deoxyheptonate aldolase
VNAIIKGEDRRLLAIVGPCSILIRGCYRLCRKLKSGGGVRGPYVRGDEDVIRGNRAQRRWKGLILDPMIDETNDIRRASRPRASSHRHHQLGLPSGARCSIRSCPSILTRCSAGVHR